MDPACRGQHRAVEESVPESLSAILVPVPDVEARVGKWRRVHDPSGRAGLVAHVTLLVPFLPPAKLDEEVETEIESILGSFAPLHVAFHALGRFPGTLYLAPEPAAPFLAMTEALVARWPEHPPYEGAYAETTPHLTVADGEGEATLRVLEDEVRRILPLEVVVREAQLVVGSNERGWRVRWRFPLGART